LAELLFWPALLAYGEAAVAYFGEVRNPGLPGRLATWGVRIGWLVQTALLAVQATRAEGFPWSDWAGSLNLFIWLVVGAYLIWGCQARFRLLGLAVMPLAVVLFALAHAAGGTDTGGTAHYSTIFLVLHVGLVSAAFAGFTLAAALSGLYLWQERRLKRHSTSLFRLPAPPLESLDRLAARTIAVALPVFTLGIGAGLVRLHRRGGSLDVLMEITLVTWAVYGSFLLLRFGRGWRGRRIAYVALAGFVLVAVLRLALPGGHFS
jgi:ABC-type uncharacterized transport system permease subunit